MESSAASAASGVRPSAVRGVGSPAASNARVVRHLSPHTSVASALLTTSIPAAVRQRAA